jgi:hypothetical protein
MSFCVEQQQQKVEGTMQNGIFGPIKEILAMEKATWGG